MEAGQEVTSDLATMISSPTHHPPASAARPRKHILRVGGDQSEDSVTDIVEKFIKVAHGPGALEDNRARENARENIRKKLAMEAGREKSDSCDLQVTPVFIILRVGTTDHSSDLLR